MTHRSSTIREEQLQRIRSGLNVLLWAFVLMLLPMVFLEPLGLRHVVSYEFGWLSAIPPILSIIAVSRIRGVVTEMQSNGEAISELQAIEKLSVCQQIVRHKENGKTRDLSHEMNRKLQAAEIKHAHLPKKTSLFENVDWEEWVGKKLLQKVGILIVLIGMIVFLKYSFDNHLIGELGRISLSTVAAVVLLGMGELFQKKYNLWSQAFTGGGLVLLYFTVWAAHVFYHQELLSSHGISVSPAMAMGLYSLITFIGAIASIRYNSQTIAWFTTLGGYLTPLLISSPEPNFVILTCYLAVLAAGILSLSWYRKWPHISLAAFLLTQFYLFGLVYTSASVSDAQQTLIAIGFFIVFALPPLLHQFRSKLDAETDDIALILLDGATAFLGIVDALGGFGGEYVGLVSLLLAAVYTAFAGAALWKRSNDTLLVNTYLLAGIGLISLALYAQMEWQWVAAGWAPLSVLLLLIAIRLERKSVFGCATTLLIGSVVFLGINLPVLRPDIEALWHPFTSHWALLSYVVFTCLLGWIHLGKNLPKNSAPSETFGENLKINLHRIIALIVFAAITFEATGLHFTITLPLALSYLAFSLIAIIVFAATGLTVWFVTAFLVQILVLLFTFVFGETSGMVGGLMNGPHVVPFLHPWAGVSVLSLFSIACFLWVILRQKNNTVSTGKIRLWLIAIASSQVWMHLTVEIQHMQSAFSWSDTTFERVLSGWWILFCIPFFSWGIKHKQQFVVRAAIFALCIPLAKDMLLILSGQGNVYEVSLWTALPLALVSISSRLKVRDLVVAGSSILAVTMAVDMLHTVASDAGLIRTIWWAVVGLITMSIGFSGREKTLRRLAIGIFAATVVKLLLFDFASLSTGVRIVASILTGLLLIGASYLYQRFDNLWMKHNH